MSHYRSITIENPIKMTYNYVVGTHNIKIVGVGLFRKQDVYPGYNLQDIGITPSDIVDLIMANCPVQGLAKESESTWDTPRAIVTEPKAKKVDPGPKTRGFAKLIGVRIEQVYTDVLNQVILVGDDGSDYIIDAESSGPLGFPVISMTVEYDQ